MRITMAVGVVALVLSTAAIAQVVSPPVEQKTAPGNDSSGEMAANATATDKTAADRPIANTAPADPAPTTMGNDVSAPHPSETKLR